MDERISKLPKWAQDEFRRICRERDVAVERLQSYEDEQTESPIHYDDFVSDGCGQGPTIRRKYINGTNQVIFEHKGVWLRVSLTEEGGLNRDAIQLQWGGLPKHSTKVAAFVPCSFQMARIVSRENMDD